MSFDMAHPAFGDMAPILNAKTQSHKDGAIRTYEDHKGMTDVMRCDFFVALRLCVEN